MADAHVVRVGLRKIGPGSPGVLIQEDSAVSAGLEFSAEHRIFPKDGVPNSADFPTIEVYIEAEATAGFILRHMSQNIIVTIKE